MKKFLSVVVFIIIAGVFCGCYNPYGSFKLYPWNRAECWYCAEIDMTICFSVDQEGNILGPTYSQLTVGDIVHDVGIGFQNNTIGFLCDLDGDGLSEGILDGTWTCQGEQMVITVHEETIWDGQYTELVFFAMEQ